MQSWCGTSVGWLVAVRMTNESMQEPYTPLLPLMGSLLNEASANVGYSTYSPDKPLSQTYSEQANVQILQDAGFCNIQVRAAVNTCSSCTFKNNKIPLLW